MKRLVIIFVSLIVLPYVKSIQCYGFGSVLGKNNQTLTTDRNRAIQQNVTLP